MPHAKDQLMSPALQVTPESWLVQLPNVRVVYILDVLYVSEQQLSLNLLCVATDQENHFAVT